MSYKDLGNENLTRTLIINYLQRQMLQKFALYETKMFHKRQKSQKITKKFLGIGSRGSWAPAPPPLRGFGVVPFSLSRVLKVLQYNNIITFQDSLTACSLYIFGKSRILDSSPEYKTAVFRYFRLFRCPYI